MFASHIAALVLVAAACSTADDAVTTTDASADPGIERAAAAGYDLQGHRGARGLRPENTLPSFEMALDLGVTTLELDMHLSADGVVVVWHDPFVDPAKCRVDPAASPPPPDPAGEGPLMVSALTAAQLAGYRCDLNPDPEQFPDQVAQPGTIAGDAYHIATLGEVFSMVDTYADAADKTPKQRSGAAAVRFNIETKRVVDEPESIGDDFDGATPGAFELAVLATVEQAGMLGRTVIQSFDHRSLWAIRTTGTDVDLAALTRRGDIPDFDDLADRGADIWSPDRRSVNPDTLAAAHDAGLAVIPWTINDSEEMLELVALGVDGIITDRPDLAPPQP